METNLTLDSGVNRCVRKWLDFSTFIRAIKKNYRSLFLTKNEPSLWPGGTQTSIYDFQKLGLKQTIIGPHKLTKYAGLFLWPF